MKEEEVVLVDDAGYDLVDGDGSIRTMGKTEAHKLGLKHLAVSVFIMDGSRLLLQQRAHDKYHSGGLWTNTCCTHPRPGETPLETAQRRLKEEMGIATPLEELFQFAYSAECSPSVFENEYDHVFVGSWQGIPVPDRAEVSDWRWVDLEALEEEIASEPDLFTYWLRQALAEFVDHMRHD